MPVNPRKCVFGMIFDFPEVRTSTLGATFSAKETSKSDSSVVVLVSGCRPGRDLALKTVQGSIFLDFGRFWADFGPILDQFYTEFQRFPTYIERFLTNFMHLLFKISFQKPSSHKHLKPENTTNPQTTTTQTSKHNEHKNPQSTYLKSWPSGMRVSD